MFKSKKLHTTIIIAIVAAVGLAGVALFCFPPALSSDLSESFQVLRSMRLGAGFNILVIPDQGNISLRYSQFFTWWSPGQYLVPYCLQLITGLNMGRCIALTVPIAELLGLAGLYFFFLKLGFSKNIAAVSMLVICAQIAFVLPYEYYNGGEVLLFAFEGWFLFGCVSFKKPGPAVLIFVCLSAFTGFFLKSSFLWIYGAGLICLCINLSGNPKRTIGWLKMGIWVIIPAGLSVLVIYIFFISRGESPADVSTGFKLSWEAFAYPAAAPLLTGFSVDELMGGLETPIGTPLINPLCSFIALILTALLSLALVLVVLRSVNNKTYRLFLVAFYGIAILFFTHAYLSGLDISMEARHFRVIGLLITPGVVCLVSRIKSVLQLSFAAFILLVSFFAFSQLVDGFKNNSTAAKGWLGVAQRNIDQQSLNYLLKLDRESKGITIALVGSDTGLEILHNRFIALTPLGKDLINNSGDYDYWGHPGPLYIILPVVYHGAREKLILSGFHQYKGFSKTTISPQNILYTAR